LKKIIILNKKEGETPLEALEKFRKKNKEYKEVPMTYAGRLDPMASGVLLILTGEECKKKEKYLVLSKEYKFQILFGFTTDTYDILGKVSSCARQNFTQEVLVKKIKDNLKHFTGKFIQEYPTYSSKTVRGKPLFQYAREGKEVKSPKREVFVKSLRLGKIRIINPGKLFKNIEIRIQKVKGDFRQEEILEIWRKVLKSPKKNKEVFFLADFHISCSSGTYVRAIANDLGERIGVPALALTIVRTKIGKWSK